MDRNLPVHGNLGRRADPGELGSGEPDGDAAGVSPEGRRGPVTVSDERPEEGADEDSEPQPRGYEQCNRHATEDGQRSCPPGERPYTEERTLGHHRLTT